jgi:hypothetical protein
LVGRDDEPIVSEEGNAEYVGNAGVALGRMPRARECALLLLLLIKTKEDETGKTVSRFRVSELTLCRMWGRRRITPEFVEAVNDWLARADRVLFFSGSSYGVILTSAVESWSRISSKRIQAEIDAALAGTFDFEALEEMLNRSLGNGGRNDDGD